VSAETIRVYIGSGEASRIERKVLIHTLRKHASGAIEIFTMNGTHDALEHDGDPPAPMRLPLSIKYANVTEFSNYRFIIPRLAGGSGRAIYLDSDMVCLRDIRELFEAPLGENAFLAKPEAYGGAGDAWGLSVMLMDCARARFDIERYFEEISAGAYGYHDLHRMNAAFLARHPFRIGRIDPRWNEFDRYDADTRLIHYTNLMAQPWKFPGHPAGELWFREFEEAREAGVVTEEDIRLSMARAAVRPNLLEGNSPAPPAPAAPPASRSALRTLLGRVKRRLVGGAAARAAR